MVNNLESKPKTFKDVPKGQQSPAIIAVGNCEGLQRIEDAIKSGKPDEAIKLVDELLQKNFQSLIGFARLHQLEPESLMGDVLDFLTLKS